MNKEKLKYIIIFKVVHNLCKILRIKDYIFLTSEGFYYSYVDNDDRFWKEVIKTFDKIYRPSKYKDKP